ncbi:uncharacterized protein TNCV_2591381 [Trichonephila clavipes]|nr:uncharacterized protein TNCV_2591381 [Trichonephila clavipes]
MIPAYNKKRCAAVPFETGIHFWRKTDFFHEENTTMSYSGFEPETTRLQADGHSHQTGWATMAFVYNVCTVRTGVVIHKQKCSTHGAPKQTYMLFQNDIPKDVVCRRYTLNMQISSGTKNNSSPNEPSCTTVKVSFNGILLVVTGTWRLPY